MNIARALILCLALLLALPAAYAGAGDFGGEEGEGWTAGFGKAELIPPELGVKDYYMAGYRAGYRAEGMLDPMMARALWLDDGTGRGGVALVAVDCVGLMRPEIEKIKAMLADFVTETGCRAIHIMSTHTHAGVDTMGLWGPTGTSGRDDAFMEIVREGICQAVKDAYADARPGEFYIGATRIEGLQRDSRDPQVFDDRLTRLRFVPEDGSREVHVIHFSVHPEELRSDNNLVSADFPCYMGQRIAERTGAEFVYFTGAIGGLITTFNKPGSTQKHTKDMGDLLGDAACDIRDETPIPPRLDTVTKAFLVPAENVVFIMAMELGVMEAATVPEGEPNGLSLDTEITYMELGGRKIVLVPGELFPELAYGGAFEEGATGPASMNPPTLAELVGDDSVLIFGLANDEVGYIMPPNDFFVHATNPYVERGVDARGISHYEETNSVGPQTAECVADALAELLEEIRN